MRHLISILLISASFEWGTPPAAAEPPTDPFGQSSAFVFNTKGIVFADTSPLAMTAASDGGGLPLAVPLRDPQPNPFNPVVLIPFSVGCRVMVELGICDLRGRLVRQLASGLMTEGSYSEQWDGRQRCWVDVAGRPVSGAHHTRYVARNQDDHSRKITCVRGELLC